jgi:pimeloyl-ACP methyl ester carboxylesterase
MVRTEAGPVAALEAGPADGPPTLLVPGFTGSKEDFGPLLAPLAEAGLHALAVDLPGQLDSPGPDAPERYSPDALAHCVRAVAASMGAPVRLVGHSFGGLVSRAAVIAAPDAFTSLVLLDSGPAALPGPRAERIALLRPFLPELGVVGIYAANEAAEADEPGYVPHPPELAAFYERRFLAGSEAMLLGMGDALLSEPDRVAELAATGVRTLVLFGADDDAWPPALQREMAGRLGAACEMITDAAHSPAVENPDATAAALLAFWEAGGELER